MIILERLSAAEICLCSPPPTRTRLSRHMASRLDHPASTHHAHALVCMVTCRHRPPPPVVWTQDRSTVSVPPSAPTGWPRRYPPLEATPAPQDLKTVARQLPASAWKKVSWRAGTRSPQWSRCAKLKVWAAHGWRAQEQGRRRAADRMAGRRSGTDEVLAGAVGTRPPRSTSFGEDGGCALADRDGLP